jgi:hypothetical protein
VPEITHYTCRVKTVYWNQNRIHAIFDGVITLNYYFRDFMDAVVKKCIYALLLKLVPWLSNSWPCVYFGILQGVLCAILAGSWMQRRDVWM